MSSAIQIAAKRFTKMVTSNSPTILTSLGVAGLITTVSLAIFATPKAMAILEQEEEDRANEHVEPYPITKLDTIKLTWKCYIPAATVGVSTIACIIGANSINLRRNAALVGLYTLAERSMSEYQAKVIETIGKNKEEKIKGEINQSKLDQNPVSESTVIVTEKGTTLMYDCLSGRYFKNDIEAVRRAQNDFNASLLVEMDKPLNDFYHDLNIPGTKTGRETGWSIDHGMLEIIFSAKIADDGQPCIVLDYKNGPRPIK